MSAYLTIKETAEIEGVSAEAIRLSLNAQKYADTRLADSIAKNGKRPTLIHINSLSIAAQIKYFQTEEESNTRPDAALTAASEADRAEALKRLKIVREASAIKTKFERKSAKPGGKIAALKAFSKEKNTSYQTLNRWLRDFKKAGFVGLLPKTGTPRKSRFDSRILEAIQSEWLQPTQPSQKDVYDKVYTYCIENLLDPPSYKTVQRTIDKIPHAVSQKRPETSLRRAMGSGRSPAAYDRSQQAIRPALSASAAGLAI